MAENSNIGQKKNFLTVIGEDTTNGKRYVTCRCDCGAVKRIQYGNWKREKVKSCGCMHDVLCSNKSKIHGDSGGKCRLYRIWRAMICRCTYPSMDNYERYGGRGISVCDEWRNDYAAFKKWAMANGYDDTLSIDRIDTNGNYEPNNCRWATLREQRANQRPRRKKTWEIDGIVKPRIEWCEEFGKSIQCVMYRIEKMGMSPKDALTM